LDKIADWQQQLNQKIAALARRVKETGSLRPVFFLAAIAFLYGVLHAAGPGHGKAVATSFMISHGSKLGGGVLLGNLLALFHGLSGVVLVMVVHFILNRGLTGPLEEITRTTQLISYSLIALVGIALLVKNVLSWRRKGSMEPKHYGKGLGEAKKVHVPVALAVGMIPCPGVVLVMLFSISLGMVGFGLLLALFLILGMAVTISTAGVVGVAGKKLTLGFLARRRQLAVITRRAIEIAAALLVTALGLFFLAATI
jgi:ABC-type nickel/cobalt efflux system permease component RcnA